MTKDFFRIILARIFKVLTSIYLKIYRIEVIAITGSVGKTTAKMAISQMVKLDGLYVPKEGYNTEIGLPLAVFKMTVPETNLNRPDLWLKIMFSMLGKLFVKPEYTKIVLEMGADQPGDIKHLSKMAKPKVVIVTSVVESHLSKFGTIEQIAKEKALLVEALTKTGTAILNIDNKFARLMATRTRAKKIFVGEDKGADLRWEKLVFKPTGISFILYVRGQKYQVRTKFFAPQLLPSLLSAFALGLVYNLEVRELLNALEKFEPEKGRMNVIKGIEDTTIIDDTYNSNPESLRAALDVLSKFPGRKIAVLGSMNELGSHEKKAHLEAGKKAGSVAGKVLTVGEAANNFLAPEAKKVNKKFVQKFENSTDAGKVLKTIIKQGDVILFKGSQNNIYMEEAIKPLLPKGVKAEEVLVRQSKMWEDKKRQNLEREK